MRDDQAEFSNPPGRRIAGLALIRNGDGGVLLTEKAYRPGRLGFGLVGGAAEPDEPAPFACQRTVLGETGLRLVPGRVLVVHHMLARGEAREGISFVFDCGLIAADTPLAAERGELRGYRWAQPEALRRLVAPAMRWRIEMALDALRGGPVRFLVGHPEARWETAA